tara:strand:+ start:647 stop:922 length:276 start_codon:yes stop_codon:yes gene_type:complete
MIRSEYVSDRETWFFLEDRSVLAVECAIRYDEQDDMYKVQVFAVNCAQGYTPEELNLIFKVLEKAKQFCEYKNLEHINKQGKFNFGANTHV